LAAAKAVDPEDGDAIDAILAEANALTPMRREKVFQAIKRRTSHSIQTIRDQAKAQGKAAPEKIDHLDLARHVIKDAGRENLLCEGDTLWMWSSKGAWSPVGDRVLKQRLQRKADEIGVAVTTNLVNGALDALKSEMHVQGHRWNVGDPEAVNCVNGELVVSEFGLALRPHRREHYRTTQIPVALDPSANAPRFEQFLVEVYLHDEDKAAKISATLELIGYTLMSHARHEKFVILTGSGANGKSVLLKVIEALCGRENTAGVQPKEFENRFQRAHLHNKLANIVTELDQGAVLPDGAVKTITSGEPMTVERKFEHPFDMHPFATLWMGTNHMPRTTDHSNALFRRAVVLTFNRTFALDEQDPHLKDRLTDELPGILNLALSAYAQAVEHGFTEPASSREAKKRWRFEVDPMPEFVERRCQRQDGAREPIGALYDAFQKFQEDLGEPCGISKIEFGRRLTGMGFGKKRTNIAHWVEGIRLTYAQVL
jgi:putative DNA primase/helicase